MISKCPRCKGSLYTREGYHEVESNCLNCGYEPFLVPAEVRAEFQTHYGKRIFVNRAVLNKSSLTS